MSRATPSLRVLPVAGVLLGGLLAVLHAAGDGQSVEAQVPESPAVLSSGSSNQDGAVLGMTVSCPTWGWEWGSDAMVDTLDELAGLGVNWVAIHPYGGIRNDGSIRFREIDAADPPDWLARPIREAHARGMKILIKPHIAYWGSQWSWRGEIAFPSEETRGRFFADYERWIGQLAAASRGADAFAVGTELDKTIQHEAEWRRIVARVRSHYEGPLTYAANWTDFRRVPFWDALDAVGIQAYFPIVTEEGEDQGLPSPAQLDAGWRDVMRDVRALSARVGKPVVFTELGYNASSRAAATPWKYETGGEGAAEVQARCLEAAMRAMDGEPSVVGAFLWKWFPGRAVPSDFSHQTPTMRSVIERNWGAR